MGQASYWDGEKWVSAQVDSPFEKSKVSLSQPSSAAIKRPGDMFIDPTSANPHLNIWTGATWTPIKVDPTNITGLNASTSQINNGVVPIGTIQIFAGDTAPSGWLLCNGASFSSSTYPLLAAVIGTKYGGTTANPLLPNMSGRVPVGRDTSQQSINTVGNTGGAATHTLSSAEMPVHAHANTAVATGGAVTAQAYQTPISATATGGAVGTQSYSVNPTASASGGAVGDQSYSAEPSVSSSLGNLDHAHGPGSLAGYSRGREQDDTGTAAHGYEDIVYSGHNQNASPNNVIINSGETAGPRWYSGVYPSLSVTFNKGSHTHSFTQPTITVSAGTHTHSFTQPTIAVNPGAHTHSFTQPTITVTNANAGNGSAHNNMQPYIVMNYIIRAA